MPVPQMLKAFQTDDETAPAHRPILAGAPPQQPSKQMMPAIWSLSLLRRSCASFPLLPATITTALALPVVFRQVIAA